MKFLDNLYSKIELPAFGLGAIVGFSDWIGNFLVALLTALGTGAAAALGAHLLKALINKLNKNKNHGKP